MNNKDENYPLSFENELEESINALNHQSRDKLFKVYHFFLIGLGCSFLLFLQVIFDFFESSIQVLPLLQLILGTILQMFLGGFFLFLFIKQRKFYDLFVFVSTAIIYFYSLWMYVNHNYNQLYFNVIAAIFTLSLFGKWLYELLNKNILNTIQNLFKLVPKHVFKLNLAGNLEKIEKESIQAGEVVTVPMNFRFPFDGLLKSEKALLDETALFGGEEYILKEQRTPIYGGSLNKGNSIEIEAKEEIKSNYLFQMVSQILKQVFSEEVGWNINSISKAYLVIIFFLAILSFVIWSFADSHHIGVIIAFSIFIAASPITLGLASPLTLYFTTAFAKNNGFFFKHPSIFEKTSRLEMLIVDPLYKLSSQCHEKLKNLKIEVITMTADEIEQLNNPEIMSVKGLASFKKFKKIIDLQRSQKIVGMLFSGTYCPFLMKKIDVTFSHFNKDDNLCGSTDISFINETSNSLVHVIELSKGVVSKIKQNIFFSFLFNIFAIPIAIIGLLTPFITAKIIIASLITIIANTIILRMVFQRRFLARE